MQESMLKNFEIKEKYHSISELIHTIVKYRFIARKYNEKSYKYKEYNNIALFLQRYLKNLETTIYGKY